MPGALSALPAPSGVEVTVGCDIAEMTVLFVVKNKEGRPRSGSSAKQTFFPGYKGGFCHFVVPKCFLTHTYAP